MPRARRKFLRRDQLWPGAGHRLGIFLWNLVSRDEAGDFTQLLSLTNTLGYAPAKTFALGADGAIYGTMSAGGLNGSGTAFRLTTNASYTVLANFNFSNPGGTPLGGLTLGADATTNFYGTCQGGGANTEGTIYRLAVNPDAYTNSTLSLLASFYSTTNGSQPGAGITVGQDGRLYGVTYYGVTSAWGCFYSMPATGGAISLLGLFNNGGGLRPKAPPVLGPDGNFCGTTTSGGTNNGSGLGTVFRLLPSGTNYNLTNLVVFTTGIQPDNVPAVGPAGNLYGTASTGGAGGGGTIYRFSFDRTTSIAPTESNALISATGTTGGSYALYATTSLAVGTWTNLVVATATNSLASFTDTNAWRFPQRFYRTAAQ